MVSRRIVDALAFPFRSFVPAAMVFASLVAQEPGVPAPSAGAPTEAAKPAGSAAPAGDVAGATKAEEAQDAAPVYGRIVADDVRLRCWASAVAAPPVFEDTLAKDRIVMLGRSENGFRAVKLPLGPVGYVSKRFVSEDNAGVVVTQGNKVAFRYRPRTSEAPVAQMADATQLHVIALEDGWYKARVAGVDAWVAAAEVQVVPTDPEIVKAHEQFAASMRAPIDARLQAIATAAKKKAQDRIDLEAVKVVESAYAKEVAKPMEEQRLEGIEQTLAKVVAELPEDSEARVAAAMLKKRMKAQKWLVEASMVRDSKPPETAPVKVVEQPKDRLERFESIGWLRYERRLAGPGRYYLEKGSRKQMWLTCRTGRFDLSLFVGREVGVIGPRRNPPTETMTVLDVERIEVLGSKAR